MEVQQHQHIHSYDIGPNLASMIGTLAFLITGTIVVLAYLRLMGG